MFRKKTELYTNLQRLRLIKEVMHLTWYYKHYWCFLNLLSPIYYHSPNTNRFWKTLSSLVTLLTIRLHRVCNKLFKRIFITWCFKNGINRGIGRFFWADQYLSKKDILFFLQYYVKSNHRKMLYKIIVLYLWSKTLEICIKDVYTQILVLPIFEVN